MPSVTTCPKCYHHVLLPLLDDQAAWVRCPLCRGEYTLQTALDFVPPSLEIIAGPTPSSDQGAFQGIHMAGAPQAAGLLASEHGSTDPMSHAHASLVASGENSAHGAGHGAGLAEHAGAAAPDSDEEFMFAEDEAEVADAFGHSSHSVVDDELALDRREHQDDFSEGGQPFGAAHDEGGDAGHSLGGIATMVAAQPVKVKRKVPLGVKLAGIGIFLVLFLLVDVLVYAGLLYFGIDLIGLQKYFPSFVVAKSLREPGTTDNTAKDKRSESIRGNAPVAAINAQASTDTTPAVAPDKAVAPDPTKPDTGPKSTDVATTKTPDKPIDLGNPDDPIKPTTDKPIADIFGDTKPVKTPTPVKTDDNPKPDATAPDKKPDDKPADTKPTDVKPADVKPTETLGLKSEGTFAMADLEAALTTAKQSHDAYEQAVKSGDKDDMKAKRIKQSRDLSHLASVLANVKTPDAAAEGQAVALRGQVAELIGPTSVLGSPEEQAQVGNLAGRWIAFSGRKENGVFAVGTLKKTTPAGKLFESQIEPAGGAAPITVVTATKPEAPEGSVVTVFGAIVKEPAKTLMGYEGAADTAVWGMTVTAAPKSDAAGK